jgi:hypothetical protein
MVIRITATESGREADDKGSGRDSSVRDPERRGEPARM